MFYIGIDGGGTKTKAVLIDSEGNVLGVGNSGPSSIRTVSNQVSKQNILEAIKQCIGDKNITITAVFAGLGDIESRQDKELVQSFLEDSPLLSNTSKIQVESDVYNALYGGLGILNEGVSVIIGTGSVAFGVKDNKTNRVGGYSFKEGDPGSSFDLGRMCLWHVSKILDGRKKRTAFGEALLDVLKISTRVSYVEMLDEYYLDRTKTAQLARLVTTYAELHDEYALEILNEGVKGIVEIIDTCSNNLDLSNKNVAIIGSLGNYPTYFLELKRQLEAIDENYNVFPSLYDPCVGAVIGALKLDEKNKTTKVLNRLKQNTSF